MRCLPEATDDECWLTYYKGARNGYPQICIVNDEGRETMRTISRLVWEMHNAEPIPEGMHVLHSCDNPRCINPHHLSVGTHEENMRQKAERGRASPSNVVARPFRRTDYYIYRRTRGSPEWRVIIPNNPFSPSFHTVDEAIAYRDSVICVLPQFLPPS